MKSYLKCRKPCMYPTVRIFSLTVYSLFELIICDSCDSWLLDRSLCLPCFPLFSFSPHVSMFIVFWVLTILLLRFLLHHIWSCFVSASPWLVSLGFGSTCVSFLPVFTCIFVVAFYSDFAFLRDFITVKKACFLLFKPALGTSLLYILAYPHFPLTPTFIDWKNTC